MESDQLSKNIYIYVYIHCTSTSKLLHLVVGCSEDIVRRLSRLILSTKRENGWRNGTSLKRRMWLKWIWSFIKHLTFQKKSQHLVLTYSESTPNCMRIWSRHTHKPDCKALKRWIEFRFFFFKSNPLSFIAKDSFQSSVVLRSLGTKRRFAAPTWLQEINLCH